MWRASVQDRRGPGCADARDGSLPNAAVQGVPIGTPVGLVIPAWNEAGSISGVLSEVPPGAVDLVFVVCRGGEDTTATIARAHGARTLWQLTPGYGAACWQGAHAAAAVGARTIVFLDGDYSDPPADLPRILAPLLAGTADLVLGYRKLDTYPHVLPLHARFGNRLVLGILHILLGRRLRDLPSFKAIRWDCLERLEMSEMTYGWTTELIVKAVRARLRILEVPVRYRPRLAGKSKISGTVRGTLGAGWKLCSCAVRYARWTPHNPESTHGLQGLAR
jgi:glycosyltransferase involved in cell wall biosynthesis